MKTVPEISYIVSAYNRPDMLPCCLWSLKAQSHKQFEVIVTDNATDEKIAQQHKLIVAGMNDDRFHYYRTTNKIKVSDCYWSAKWAMDHVAKGMWYCFPCDDNYYLPEWSQQMLGTATINNWDLVLCNSSIGPLDTTSGRRYLAYQLGTQLFPGYKPSFLIKASSFKGWMNMPTNNNAVAGVDRTTLMHLLSKVAWGVCRDLYYVHN